MAIFAGLFKIGQAAVKTAGLASKMGASAGFRFMRSELGDGRGMGNTNVVKIDRSVLENLKSRNMSIGSLDKNMLKSVGGKEELKRILSGGEGIGSTGTKNFDVIKKMSKDSTLRETNNRYTDTNSFKSSDGSFNVSKGMSYAKDANKVKYENFADARNSKSSSSSDSQRLSKAQQNAREESFRLDQQTRRRGSFDLAQGKPSKGYIETALDPVKKVWKKTEQVRDGLDYINNQLRQVDDPARINIEIMKKFVEDSGINVPDENGSQINQYNNNGKLPGLDKFSSKGDEKASQKGTLPKLRGGKSEIRSTSKMSTVEHPHELSRLDDTRAHGTGMEALNGHHQIMPLRDPHLRGSEESKKSQSDDTITIAQQEAMKKRVSRFNQAIMENPEFSRMLERNPEINTKIKEKANSHLIDDPLKSERPMEIAVQA